MNSISRNISKHDIEINWQLRHSKLRAPQVRKLAQVIVSLEVIKKKSISILICDDTQMTQLNSQFRDKHQPTDVLSFESGEPGEFLGDIAISLTTTEKQAEEYNVSFEAEFKRLLIHGVLHLLGYDHERSDFEKAIMEQREAWIFKEVETAPLC